MDVERLAARGQGGRATCRGIFVQRVCGYWVSLLSLCAVVEPHGSCRLSAARGCGMCGGCGVAEEGAQGRELGCGDRCCCTKRAAAALRWLHVLLSGGNGRGHTSGLHPAKVRVSGNQGLSGPT